MLQITIPAADHLWDEVKEEFVTFPEQKLILEHSLISISKWEGIFHKPFIGGKEKTITEVIEYVKCMTINRNVPDEVYLYIPSEEYKRIQEYIDDDHTATFFREIPGQAGASKKKDIVTSEVIYYYMISLGIPVQFEQWHLGRLMTLIKVCNEKNKEQEEAAKRKGKGRRMSRLTTKEQTDLAARYHEINEARKKALGTTG